MLRAPSQQQSAQVVSRQSQLIINSKNNLELIESLAEAGKENESGCSDVSHSDTSPDPPVALRQVGDNTASSPPPARGGSTNENPPPVPPYNPSALWLKEFAELREFASQTCQELKRIGSQLNTLDKIDQATDTLSKQMTGVLQRTTALEDTTEHNTNAIKALQEDLRCLKSTVATQEKTIADLQLIKEEFIKINADFSDSADQKVVEFNNLIGIQQKQVDAFHETNQRIQDAILENVTQHVDERMDDKMKVWTEAEDHDKLIDRAKRNKNNLVIIGLQEDNQSPLDTASNFVSSTPGY